MVSFNMVSLYAKIQVNQAVNIIKELTDEETTNLVKVILASTYFSLWGEIYEQTHTMALGSPLSLVVANIFMENFKEKSINSFSHKPEQWRWYIDNTNFIWPHGKDRLGDFLIHMKNQSEHIKFIVETEVC